MVRSIAHERAGLVVAAHSPAPEENHLVDRRRFIALSFTGVAGAATFGPGFWQQAFAAPAQPGPGPYGPLSSTPDANGLLLPQGFTSRIVAVAGRPVGPSGYPWHVFPDGGTVLPAEDGGWFYVGNSEVFTPGGGGASAIRFGPDSEIMDAYRLLAGTTANCSGGPTPWGTWLSGEEQPRGQVYECDPAVPLSGNTNVRPALGTFSHEAVTVDPDRGVLYMTEDDLLEDLIDNRTGEGQSTSGGYYRFTPDAYPDLSSGKLEAATLPTENGGPVTWVEIDPARPISSTQPDAQPRPGGTTQFAGSEGCWYDRGHVYFTSKVRDVVWDHDIVADRITLLYDSADFGDDAPLSGVDNIIVARSGDLFVCEDGGNMELVLIAAGTRDVAPFARLPDHPSRITEVAGPGFSPDGSRLYFSSRSWGPEGPTAPGTTFEITGPFRASAGAVPAPSPSETMSGVTPPVPSADPSSAPGNSLPATGSDAPVAGLLGLAAAGAAAWAARRAAVSQDDNP
jgi:LPXTG-motif cell wall-anchored protein